MKPIFFRPGQQIKEIRLFRRKENVNAIGRVTYREALIDMGVIYGTIASVSEKEEIRWKQMGHTITHTIIVQGGSSTKAEDLLLIDGGRYYVQAVDDPSKIGLFQIIYCEKRGEVWEDENKTGNNRNCTSDFGFDRWDTATDEKPGISCGE